MTAPTPGGDPRCHRGDTRRARGALRTRLGVPAPALAAPVVPYDIVYVRQPRFGNDTNTVCDDDVSRCWQAVFPASRRNTASVFSARLP